MGAAASISEEAQIQSKLRPSQRRTWQARFVWIKEARARILENRGRYGAVDRYDTDPPSNTYCELGTAYDREIKRRSEMYCMVQFVPTELLAMVLEWVPPSDLINTKVWLVSKEFRDIFNKFFRDKVRARIETQKAVAAAAAAERIRRMNLNPAHGPIDFEGEGRRFFDSHKKLAPFDWFGNTHTESVHSCAGCREMSPRWKSCPSCEIMYFCPKCRLAHVATCRGKKPLCAMCGAPGHKKCAGCHKMPYCGKACQTRHWNLCHRRQCKKP